MDDPDFDPSLHVVAFDGDEIAGAVVNAIYGEANAKLGVLHGWLDSVFTWRPWRGRGLARALVARSLVVLRDRGMTEGILGVDADNETGALGVWHRQRVLRHRAVHRLPAALRGGPMTLSVVWVDVPEAPADPGPGFRRMRLPDDLEAMAALFNAADIEDGVEDRTTPRAWPSGTPTRPPGTRWRTSCWPRWMASWWATARSTGWTTPTAAATTRTGAACTRTGGGGAGPGPAPRQRAAAARDRGRAAGARRHPAAAGQLGDGDAGRGASAARVGGFTVARYFFEMLRPTWTTSRTPCPRVSRSGPPEDHRSIWNADIEAFADHWGGQDLSEVTFQRFFSGPDSSRSCGASPGTAMRWRARQQHGHARAQRADRRPPRPPGGSVRSAPVARAGLARALVSQSLVAFRDRGMTDAILVDADNPTGALGVYEANGFVVHQREYAYRKPFEF